MSPDDLRCKCGAGVVYHLGGWVCLDCGSPPWHCVCLNSDGYSTTSESIGSAGPEAGNTKTDDSKIGKPRSAKRRAGKKHRGNHSPVDKG